MAQSLGGFAADAPRYGVDAEAAYYALKGAGGTAAGVTSLQTLTGDLVLASSDSSVVFTTNVGGINLSVPNALPGSVKTVVGTDNQVDVTTVAGTATVALAAPSPAPTPGTYIAPNVTVDGFGRVTAVSSAGQVAVALIYNGTTSGSASGGGQNYSSVHTNDGTPGDGNYKIMYGSPTVAAPQLIYGTDNFPMIKGHLYRISISGNFSCSFVDSAVTATIQIGMTTDAANNVTLGAPNNYALWTSPTGQVFPQNTLFNATINSSFLVLGQGQSPALYLAAIGTALPINDNFYTVSAARGSTFSYEDLGLWSGAGAVPAQPTALASSEITTTAFKVSWTQENPQATANAYTLNGIKTVPAIDASINNPSGPYAYFTGLTTGTSYTVVITPQNNLGVGTASAGLVVTTL